MMQLIAKDTPKSPAAEAFRTIRTNIQFSGVSKTIKTIALTSATPNEGKSTVIANLAVVMAQAGHKVVLLDCDFRNPTQHKIFNLTNKGLSNCIAAGDDIFGSIQKSSVPGLDILTGGPVPPNPSELLGSNRMQGILTELGCQYDYILLDTPPIMPVTDAAVLASKVDAVIMVIMWNKIQPALAKAAKTRLDQAGANIIGGILNNVDVANSGYGYGYGYYYYYGHDEGNGKQHRHKQREVK